MLGVKTSKVVWGAIAPLLFGSAIAVIPALPTKGETKVVEVGPIRAEVSYQPGDLCGEQPQVTITRAGQAVLNQAIESADWGFCKLQGLEVRDLDKNGEPEVLVNVFTGGAHCCWYSLIYSYNPDTKQYQELNQFWGNGGYQFEDLDKDGKPEFVSRDDRFAYRFASYAGSFYPPQIWQYRQGQLLGMTHQYPKVVYNQAYALWREYQRVKDQPDGGKGALAAYVATKHLLGQGDDAWRRLERTYQAADRQQFFMELGRFLRETGYMRRSS